MKIDFNARFKDIARLIDAPDTRREVAKKGPEFSELLGDIAPDRAQAADSAQKSTSGLALTYGPKSGSGEPMGSFNFDRPGLQSPQLESQAPQIYPESPVPPAGPRVKTPSVVSAKRVADPQGLQSSNREERVSEVRKLVEDAGSKFNIDPTLSLAVVSKESSFNVRAISSDGHASKGLFQLLDRTGKDLLGRFNVERSYDPYDPEQNVYLGVGYLRHLHDLFSRETDLPNKTTTVPAANSASLEKLAVAAFNAGEGRVASAQGRARDAGFDPAHYDHVEAYLPKSTREYVARVIEAKSEFGPRSSTLVSKN